MIGLLLACVAPESRVLPVQLSLLVEEQGGRPLSVVVELGRNLRDQVDLRVAEGPLLYDGRHIWEIEGNRLTDQASGRLLTMPAPGRITGLDRRAIWLDAGGVSQRCGMERWPEWSEIPVIPTQRGITCAASTEPAAPLSHHPGPGVGFKVWLDGDQLSVRLPVDGEEGGQVLMEGVERVVGVRWVRDPAAAIAPLLERSYRGRSLVGAVPLDVRVDGDLSEWVGSRPLVLQEAWHLESGGPAWHGARDASIGVSAAWSEGQLCFAGRLRDDDREPEDALEVRVGGGRIALPLGRLAREREISGQDGEGAAWALGRDWYGARYEVCLPHRTIPGTLPFVLVWRDADAGQPTTVLSSAPQMPGAESRLPRGHLRISR